MASAMATVSILALTMDVQAIAQSRCKGGSFPAEPLGEQPIRSEGDSGPALRAYLVGGGYGSTIQHQRTFWIKLWRAARIDEAPGETLPCTEPTFLELLFRLGSSPKRFHRTAPIQLTPH